jgi:hypothetical protein
MSKLGRGWGRNVRNHPQSGQRGFCPERAHTLAGGLPTGLMRPNPASLLDPHRLSTDKAALIIIIKEE